MDPLGDDPAVLAAQRVGPPDHGGGRARVAPGPAPAVRPPPVPLPLSRRRISPEIREGGEILRGQPSSRARKPLLAAADASARARLSASAVGSISTRSKRYTAASCCRGRCTRPCPRRQRQACWAVLAKS